MAIKAVAVWPCASTEQQWQADCSKVLGAVSDGERSVRLPRTQNVFTVKRIALLFESRLKSLEDRTKQLSQGTLKSRLGCSLTNQTLITDHY